MQKVRNALDLSLKPLTLPCFSSVSLAAYYLCIPGPLRASGSVSLPKIATPLEVFCKSDKKSPVFAEVMLTVPRHTSGPASDAHAQGGGRREHAKKGGSHGAERGSAARRVKGGAVALETAQQLPRPQAQLSLRKTRGQEVEAMSVAASFPKHTSFTMRASSAAADGLPETENNAGEPENTYILRPVFQQRFRPSVVKDCIHAVLKEELANAEYSPEEIPQLTKHLSENIKDKLKEMGFDRYKMVVQVVIGEQRGEGVLTVYSVL
ncbi:dynein light chain Tctex-type protein 2B isoform X3 [Bos javanicus]|uniref:dynein light chain Tctex-type protein 2B isoform X3 n=1 Tax=Bos javanicus TaxID=9906 RepID=UPI002AA7D8F0|nr:dynein light chain Tctex-type protein 2B isoform X3 [Bos javanicus]